MVVLTRAQRHSIGSPLLRKIYEEAKKTAPLSFTEIEAVIQYTEDWIEANEPSYVTDIPEPFKAKSTPAEKTFVFVYTLMRKAGLLP